MEVLEITDDERAHVQAQLDRSVAEIEAFMKKHGVKSGEALVMSDPPVSDVDAD